MGILKVVEVYLLKKKNACERESESRMVLKEILDKVMIKEMMMGMEQIVI